MSYGDANGGVVERSPLSFRMGPQFGLTVTDVEATIGEIVRVEDIENIRLAVFNLPGGAALVIGKVQKNEFSPADDDSHWVDEVPGFPPDGYFAGLASPGNKEFIIQGRGAKHYRFRASVAAGTTSLDVAWTGA